MEFLTIRQTAAQGVVSEHFLRQLVAQGSCPGLYAVKRYLVNFDALLEMLDSMSRENIRGGVNKKMK